MNRKRPHQIVIRLSDIELQILKKKVAISEKTQQAYITAALTKGKIINTYGIIEVIPELKKQGTNLNQLVKKINEGKIPTSAELDATLREVRETWQSLRRLAQEIR